VSALRVLFPAEAAVSLLERAAMQQLGSCTVRTCGTAVMSIPAVAGVVSLAKIRLGWGGVVACGRRSSVGSRRAGRRCTGTHVVVPGPAAAAVILAPPVEETVAGSGGTGTGGVMVRRVSRGGERGNPPSWACTKPGVKYRF